MMSGESAIYHGYVIIAETQCCLGICEMAFHHIIFLRTLCNLQFFPLHVKSDYFCCVKPMECHNDINSTHKISYNFQNMVHI